MELTEIKQKQSKFASSLERVDSLEANSHEIRY
jgi:hypothetical protein